MSRHRNEITPILLVALVAAVTVVACSGNKQTPASKEFCRSLSLISKTYAKEYAAVWSGPVNVNDVTPELNRQVILEKEKLDGLRQIKAPASISERYDRYLLLTGELVRQDRVYLATYRRDKTAQRNTIVTKGLYKNINRLSRNLRVYCSNKPGQDNR